MTEPRDHPQQLDAQLEATPKSKRAATASPVIILNSGTITQTKNGLYVTLECRWVSAQRFEDFPIRPDTLLAVVRQLRLLLKYTVGSNPSESERTGNVRVWPKAAGPLSAAGMLKRTFT